MSNKIKVGVLGCTGAVGQKFISLLQNHKIFEISALAASENSAGQKYGDRVKWREAAPINDRIKNITISRCDEDLDAKILFSGLDSSVAGEVEEFYASKGYAVVSNSKNHRKDKFVPLIIPEINKDHFEIIKQQESYKKSGGFIVTNPNCSTIMMVMALFPIYKKFGLTKVIATTMQAISGAGYPGVPSMDILGNIIPYIGEEEGKMESEPLKIFGTLKDNQILNADFKISASCNRVPVREGHMVSISFETKIKATRDEIIECLHYDNLNLPSSPECVLQYFNCPSRPQPLLDANTGNGLTVSAGNLRECNVLDWKITSFGHNTIRGAAGGAILNAEYLVANNYIK